ncbi:MAG: hypothetical protein E7621_03095 [Ruminococcaceae bacterium]|nr:hypothetical protein [Oscillospiraceae bacterium]
MAISANAKECGIKNALEKLIGTYSCESFDCESLDLNSLADKLKNFSWITKGSCGANNDNSGCANGSCNENTGNSDCTDGSCGSENDSWENIFVVPPEIFETPEIEQEEIPDTSQSDDSLEQQVIDLVNKYRAQNGLSSLSYDKGAACAASIRAKETETSFSHTRPDGSRCFTALDECGVSYSGAGENIAMGQTSAESVMTDWMNSEGHRENILNPNFKKIGVGVHKGSDGRLYWAQMFIY